MSMNVTGLSLDEVTRLLRLAERDVETLQAAVRKADAYAKRLEAELEAVSPECPSCLQLRRDRGGDPRAPAGQHQGDCPAVNARGDSEDCPCGHEDALHFEGRCAASGCDCEARVESDFIERCAAAFDVDEVHRLIADFRSMDGNAAGGSLHVVLDDGNIGHSTVEWCRVRAVEKGDSCGAALASLLLRLDEGAYTKVLAPNPRDKKERAMSRVEISKCDGCREQMFDEGGTGKLTVEVRVDGKREELDLCPGCVAGVRRFLQDHRAPIALQDGGVAYLRRDGSTVTTQGPPLVFEATEPTPPPQVPGFTVMPTGDVAFHTGRPRHRVVCDACGEEVHEGTTGPEAIAAYHTCEPAAPAAEGAR